MSEFNYTSMLDPRDKEITLLRAALAEAEARLPEGMKHCTIQYKKCEVGHGRLIATNWVDHGCPWCSLAKAEWERDSARAQCRADIAAIKREIARAERAESDLVDKSRQMAELQEQLHHLFGIEQSRDRAEADLAAAREVIERAPKGQ